MLSIIRITRNGHSKNLDHQVGKRIYQALESIRENPRTHIEDMKRPKGAEPLYKYRVEEHRVIMALFDTELVVLVVDIGPRRSIYKKTVERDNPDLREPFSRQAESHNLFSIFSCIPSQYCAGMKAVLSSIKGFEGDTPNLRARWIAARRLKEGGGKVVSRSGTGMM